MTIINIIREHVDSGAPWDEHGRCHIVLSKGDAHALRMTDSYQRGARFLRDVEAAEPPAGCRYVATLQFTRPVNVYEWLGERLPTGTVGHTVKIPRPMAATGAGALSARMATHEGSVLHFPPDDFKLSVSSLLQHREPRIIQGLVDKAVAAMAAPADPEQPFGQTPPG